MEKIIAFIEKLQQKPRHERVRALWLFTFASILIIVSVWLILAKHSLNQTREENADDEFAFQELEDSFQKAKDEWPVLKNNLQGNMSSLFEDDGREAESPFSQ